MWRLRTVALILLVNTAGGCLPAVFMFLFQPRLPGRVLLRECEIGCLYSFCIGTLCFAVMERIGKRVVFRRRVVQVPLLVVIFTLLALLGSIPPALICVAAGWLNSASLWPAYVHGARIAVFITLVLGGIVTPFSVVNNRLNAATLELRNRQLDEERVRKLSTEARLSSLESRVHPHFLFNTLNSISSLIRDDPKTAERTVERLAALLRYSLDSNGARLVPLRQELCVVRDYLEIEQTRYGGRLRYQINAPVELEDSEVPPFALQTLVENSVKHVVSENRQGAEISVTVRRRGTDLLLEVADDGPGFDPAAIPQGRGLDNLRGRLAGIFESQGHLDISHGEGRTVVSVTVPLKRVPA